MITSKEDYKKVALKTFRKVNYFIEAKIAKIKATSPLPNSPRQITNGGKLKAYNDVLQYLKSKMADLEK